MKTVKIGISMPDDLYRAAARRAKALHRANFSHYTRVLYLEDIAKATVAASRKGIKR